MTEEEKLAYYKSEYQGAPLVEFIGFRSTAPLAQWIKIKAASEARDYSAVIRRLLIKAAKEEGFNPDAINILLSNFFSIIRRHAFAASST